MIIRINSIVFELYAPIVAAYVINLWLVLSTSLLLLRIYEVRMNY